MKLSKDQTSYNMNNTDKVCPLHFVSIEKTIFYGLVKKVQVPGIEGELGIYPKHSPFLSLVDSGLLLILDHNNHQHFFYISGGIIEVQPLIISILADVVIRGLDLDLNSILKNKDEIKNKMDNIVDSIDRKKMKKILSYELAKLRVIKAMNVSRAR